MHLAASSISYDFFIFLFLEYHSFVIFEIPFLGFFLRINHFGYSVQILIFYTKQLQLVFIFGIFRDLFYMLNISICST